MTNKPLPLAAALVATVFLGAPTVHAQSASASPAAQSAQPSPYQGVSRPPADDIITTSDEPAGQPSPTAQTAPPSHAVPSTGRSAASPAPAAKFTPAAEPDGLDAIDALDRDRDQAALSIDSLRSSKDPDAGIVTYLPGPANALPEGTVFRVRILQSVIAADTTPGATFRAKLSQDLVHNGHIVVPMGSELLGKITYTSYGRRIGGRSVIHLRADKFVLPNGVIYPVHAEVIDTRGSDTAPAGEGNIASATHGKRTLTELAASTSGGAIIGAAAAGPAGAAVGSVIGVGAMGAHLLLEDQSVVLPEDSTVIFSLIEPLFFAPASK